MKYIPYQKTYKSRKSTSIAKTSLIERIFWFLLWSIILLVLPILFLVLGGYHLVWLLVIFSWSVIVWSFWNFFLILKVIGILIIVPILVIVTIFFLRNKLIPIRPSNRNAIAKNIGTKPIFKLPNLKRKTNHDYKTAWLEKLQLDHFLEIWAIILEKALTIIALTPIMFFEFGESHKLPFTSKGKVLTWRPGCWLFPAITIGTIIVFFISWQLALLYILALVSIAVIIIMIDY